MSAVGSLWSPDIHPNVLSPFAILEPQAKALAEQTKGLLVAEVKISHDGEKKTTSVSLDLIAPVLDNYRRRILTITHPTDMVYPARVDAEFFRHGSKSRSGSEPRRQLPLPKAVSLPEKAANEASSDEELRRLIEQVLRSHEVVSLAVSLIARSNDILKQRQDAAAREQSPTEQESPEAAPSSEGDSDDARESPE